MMIDRFDKYVEGIIEFSNANPSLKECHHFLFNLPLPNADLSNIQFITMGMNPGESDNDWNLINQKMREETHRSDFHEKYGDRGRASLKWTKSVEYFCSTKNVVQTEAFFWSSKKTDKEHFEDRFGFKFGGEECDKYFNFCKTLNEKMVAFYEPDAVILPGLSLIGKISKIYNLSAKCVLKCPDTGHRLIETYYDQNNLPWVFTKHWSGSRGFTNKQKEIIQNYIRELV